LGSSWFSIGLAVLIFDETFPKDLALSLTFSIQLNLHHFCLGLLPEGEEEIPLPQESGEILNGGEAGFDFGPPMSSTPQPYQNDLDHPVTFYIIVGNSITSSLLYFVKNSCYVTGTSKFFI
jgi:hypothetical protein